MSERSDPEGSRPVSQRFRDVLRSVVTTHPRIVAAVVVVSLILAAGVGGFIQARQQDAPITQFCSALQAQNYDSAYKLLSGDLRGQFTGPVQFQQVMTILDTASGGKGKVTVCNLNAQVLWASPIASSASRSLLIRRQTDLQGSVQVVQDQGGWKVDKVDESLLSVSLGAVAAAVGYCNALQNLDFGSAYQTLSNQALVSFPGVASSQDFTRLQILHYVVDGQITACNVTVIEEGNHDCGAGSGEANLDMDITRANVGTERGKMTLIGQAGQGKQCAKWLIDSIDPKLQGTDVGPLQVGYQLCDDLAKADGLQEAYTKLFSSGYKAQVPLPQFEKLFPFPTLARDTYGGCFPDFSTYKPPQSSASLNVGVNVLSGSTGGSPPQAPILHMALGLTKKDSQWVISSIGVTT